MFNSARSRLHDVSEYKFCKIALDPEIFLEKNYDFVLFMRREKLQDDGWGSAMPIVQQLKIEADLVVHAEWYFRLAFFKKFSNDKKSDESKSDNRLKYFCA